jgi:hypothetical protein
MRASAETLLEIARDPQHLGAEIGFFSVLHTWNQTLQAVSGPHLDGKEVSRYVSSFCSSSNCPRARSRLPVSERRRRACG